MAVGWFGNDAVPLAVTGRIFGGGGFVDIGVRGGIYRESIHITIYYTTEIKFVVYYVEFYRTGFQNNMHIMI